MLALMLIADTGAGQDGLRIQAVNSNAARLLACSPTALCGQRLAQYWPDLALAPILRLIDGHSPGGVETWQAKTGQGLVLAISAMQLAVADDQTAKIALVLTTPGSPYLSEQGCEDIELALRESEQRFRQMAELAGEWLWEQSPDGFYTYSSAAVQQILGYAPAEVLGQHYTHFLTVQNCAEQHRFAASQQAFSGLINDHRHKDGHLVYTESTGLPILAEDGRLLKWRGVDRDITAQKFYQDALIESERRTRLIIENSTNAIVMMDSYGIITDWNRQSEKIFGWSAEEALGQELAALIVPMPVRAEFRRGLKLFLHTGLCPWLNTLLEQTALRRDGSEFPVEMSVSALKIGNSYSFSGFIHDITARKAAEQQIRDAQVNLAITRSEIKIAQQIQTSLLPSVPVATEHFAVAGLCLPAHKIGGDYFDYFCRDGGALDMVIADVSGHSIGPALFMVEARSVIRSQAGGLGKPAAILAALNRFLFADLNKADYFISAFYAQYDRASRQLHYANAGHPPPLLARANAAPCEALDADGMILGVWETVVFAESYVQLAAGDVLLFYTDGLTEAENAQGEFFGLDRVGQVLRQHAAQSPHVLIEALLAALKQFCARDCFVDDVTLMVFQCR